MRTALNLDPFRSAFRAGGLRSRPPEGNFSSPQSPAQAAA